MNWQLYAFLVPVFLAVMVAAFSLGVRDERRRWSRSAETGDDIETRSRRFRTYEVVYDGSIRNVASSLRWMPPPATAPFRLRFIPEVRGPYMRLVMTFEDRKHRRFEVRGSIHLTEDVPELVPNMLYDMAQVASEYIGKE